MAFTMTLWSVNNGKLMGLPKQRLDSEDRLETWIANDPSLLGLDVLIIGRQVITSFGKKIDLLAIDADGDLVIIELKRDKTPRDVVAQVLDYASWVKDLSSDAIIEIATVYLKKPLAEAFKDRFDATLPESINSSHRMMIVASELDDSSERIVQYLASVCNLDINVVFFTCFQQNGAEFVGRSWLMDPEEVEERSETRKRGDTKWNEQTFFEALGQRVGPAATQAALAVLDWARPRAQILFGSGGKSGSIIPQFDNKIRLLSMWTNGRVQIQLGGLKGKPPFNDESTRRSLVERLSQIPGINISEDSIDKYPSFGMTILADDQVRSKFLDVLQWAVNQIKGDPE